MAFSTPHEQYIAIVTAMQCKGLGCACHFDPQTILSGNTHCPVHDDPVPSFTVTCTADRVLIDCKAGCLYEDTSQALRLIGVWPDPPKQSLTLEDLADAKKLSVDFLKSLGVRQSGSAVAIPWYDVDGHETAVKKRLALHGNRFVWDGSPTAPYGVHKLSTIYATGWVLFVQGESDAWSGWHYSLPVIGCPGQQFDLDWAHYFPEKLEKYVWLEPDEWGLVDHVVEALPDTRVIMAPESWKDISDAHIAGEDLKKLLERLRLSAKPAKNLVEERKQSEHRTAAAKALEASAGLLDDPKLISRIQKVLVQNGLAGDTRNATLLVLAFVSGVLDRPVNVLVEGPSAAGKNYVVDQTLALFPDETAYKLTSNSERTFVFTNASFTHRHLVISEAAGLHRDGIGATLVRSIAWDGRIVYEVVEKGKDGKLCTRRIERQGPTGIITTSVKTLDDELLTRFFSITVLDDRDESRKIVNELGRRAKVRPPRVDVSAFVAAFQWIRLAGNREVVIPFADTLSDRVDVSVVRVRRDFSQLLSLIQASAVLHQRQRDRDERGRIVATMDDYRLVHKLIVESLGAAQGVTPKQREAVQALQTLYEAAKAPVTYKAVGGVLKLDRRSAARRLERPLAEGFVVNTETRDGYPALLKPGDPLPPLEDSIPSPDVLQNGDPLPETPGNECPPVQGGPSTSPDHENIGVQKGGGGRTPSEGGHVHPGAQEATPEDQRGGHVQPQMTVHPSESKKIRASEGVDTWTPDSGGQGTQGGLPQAGDPDEVIEVLVQIPHGDPHA